MKLLPFKTIIGLSKEKFDAAMAPLRARSVKAKADLEMTRIETDIIKLEARAQEICAYTDVNFCQLADVIDEHDLLTRRRDQYVDILAQLFPADEPETTTAATTQTPA